MTRPSTLAPANWRELLSAKDRLALAEAGYLHIRAVAEESNGATRLIPGSHRFGRIPPKGLVRPDARPPEARWIEARAGDVIVFSAHLWHAGSKNVSGAPRRIAMAAFARSEIVELQARRSDPHLS